jgi:hypothetical protein
MPKITVTIITMMKNQLAQILSSFCSITTIRDIGTSYIRFLIFLAQLLLDNNSLLISKLLDIQLRKPNG